ncbi:hypothetical protein BpHYR1_014204 [Brachionus plicatilis]|uniref:Uncharacterized protein n=1 Tax=Brachionus plicatilis TaxID=10195 RepID=A0A3M7S9B9_BRAPC|nr:hypothetical protein BpHYR1_014204 [Brachionus plicatilis]
MGPNLKRTKSWKKFYFMAKIRDSKLFEQSLNLFSKGSSQNKKMKAKISPSIKLSNTTTIKYQWAGETEKSKYIKSEFFCFIKNF